MIYSSDSQKISVYRSQFPLDCAEAIPIHKSQGETFDKIAIPFDYKGYQRPLLYVAMSRVTSLEGLYGLNSTFTQVGIMKENDLDPISEEYQRMRNRRSELPFLWFLESKKIRIAYQNVQSLYAHIEDIKSDYLIMSADILLFCETHSIQEDDFEIPNFELIMQLEAHQHLRKNRGISIYSKIDSYMIAHQKDKLFEICTLMTAENKQIFIVYSSPSMQLSCLLSSLTIFIKENRRPSQTTILVGDFNVNFDKAVGKNFESNIFENFNLQKKSTGFTTKKRTEIDAVFSDKDLKNCIYYTPYSHHYCILMELSE